MYFSGVCVCVCMYIYICVCETMQPNDVWSLMHLSVCVCVFTCTGEIGLHCRAMTTLFFFFFF